MVVFMTDKISTCLALRSRFYRKSKMKVFITAALIVLMTSTLATSKETTLRCDVELWAHENGINGQHEYFGLDSFNVTIFGEKEGFVTDALLWSIHGDHCYAKTINKNNKVLISDEEYTLLCAYDITSAISIYIDRYDGSLRFSFGDMLRGKWIRGEGMCKKAKQKI